VGKNICAYAYTQASTRAQYTQTYTEVTRNTKGNNHYKTPFTFYIRAIEPELTAEH